MISRLHNQRVLLGVTGSIAAYKAPDLASQLTQAGALVDVILTDSAARFITALSFESVTGRRVYTDLWAADAHVQHIGLAEGAALLVVAPCSADTLAKLAHGRADNLLTITALAGGISRAALGNLAHVALIVFVLLPVLLLLLVICFALWSLVGMVADLQRAAPAWTARAATGTEYFRREVVAWCRRVQEVVHAVQHPLDGLRRAWQRYWGGRDLGFPARD